MAEYLSEKKKHWMNHRFQTVSDYDDVIEHHDSADYKLVACIVGNAVPGVDI